jgi:hypothetical protein
MKSNFWLYLLRNELRGLSCEKENLSYLIYRFVNKFELKKGD